MKEYPEASRYILSRHQLGDWGEVCAEDAAENAHGVERGLRILSVYQLGRELAEAAGEVPDPRARILIITEADRSATTILLPSEY
jgi:hypothetical protein